MYFMSTILPLPSSSNDVVVRLTSDGSAVVLVIKSRGFKGVFSPSRFSTFLGSLEKKIQNQWEYM